MYLYIFRFNWGHKYAYTVIIRVIILVIDLLLLQIVKTAFVLYNRDQISILFNIRDGHK